MKEKKIPKVIRQLVEENGNEGDEILAASGTDMNQDLVYNDGYVVLTSSFVFALEIQYDETAVHTFRGTNLRKQDDEYGRNREWSVRKYDVSDLKKLAIEPQVACNVLVMTSNDDVECRIAIFSNLYGKSMHKFVREFMAIPGKGEGGGEGKPGGHGPWGRGAGKDDEDGDYCPKCGRMYPNPERKVCPHCSNKITIFRRLLRFFLPYKFRIVVIFFIYVSVAVLNLVWPYLNGTILYDYILKKNDAALAGFGIKNGEYVLALLLVVLTMFATKLTQQILTILQGTFNARIVADVVCDIKKSIFKAMGKLSISFFRSRQTGSLMTRVLSDAERVTGFFIDDVPYIFINSFMLISMFVVMLSINWQMTVAAVLLFPICFVFGFFFQPKFWNAYGNRHRAERSVNNMVNDNLSGARVVKAFGQERKEETRFTATNERMRNSEIAITRINIVHSLIFSSTHRLAGIIIWLLGAFFILNKGTMELGILITFVGYADQMNGPMNFFARVLYSWTDSMNAGQRMFEIIDAIPEIVESENAVSLENPKGEIELRNVTFGYDLNRPVLKNVSLKIPAGSMFGIVGRSGAGKTTLVNLISRLYDPQEGSIFFDGIDIKDLTFKDLRRNVAMVSQETYIFMGTIEENIAYANPNASKEEIIRAAKLASAHDFILRMPDGYNTMVGSSGRDLSGGERQRISIARAILANPKVLILDEATASVDTETERAIQRSINYLVKGRTTISIAHRLSTLRDADYLCVIDNGEITERGNHEELEALHGTYYKLMELQTKALALKE